MREIPLVHCAGRFALAAAHGKLVVGEPRPTLRGGIVTKFAGPCSHTLGKIEKPPDQCFGDFASSGKAMSVMVAVRRPLCRLNEDPIRSASHQASR